MKVQLTELSISFDSAIWKHSFSSICEGTFWRALRCKVLNLTLVSKTRNEVSVKLLCDMWIQLKKWNLSFDSAGWKHSLCSICKGAFQSQLRPVVKNWVSHDKNLNQTICETALWCVYSVHIIKYFLFKKLKIIFLWNLRRNISEPNDDSRLETLL